MHSLDDDELAVCASDFVRSCRPAWHRRAACRGAGTALFFVPVGGDVKPAKALCSSCPVAAPCLAYANEHDGTCGIWAGQSERARRKLRKVSQAPSTVGEWSDGARSATAS